MKSIAIALMVLAGGSISGSSAEDAASEAAIRALVAEQVVAWNAGDGHA